MSFALRQEFYSRLINNPALIKNILSGDLTDLTASHLASSEQESFLSFLRQEGRRFHASAKLNIKKRYMQYHEMVPQLIAVLTRRVFDQLWQGFLADFDQHKVPKNPHQEITTFIDYAMAVSESQLSLGQREYLRYEGAKHQIFSDYLNTTARTHKSINLGAETIVKGITQDSASLLVPYVDDIRLVRDFSVDILPMIENPALALDIHEAEPPRSILISKNLHDFGLSAVEINHDILTIINLCGGHHSMERIHQMLQEEAVFAALSFGDLAACLEGLQGSGALRFFKTEDRHG